MNGCRLHLLEQGSGRPAVILEAGIAASSLSWSRVQPGLAAFTRTASYDRAGLGWSDLCAAPRTLEQMLAEFDGLLRAAAIPAPYILVGHSFGGLLIRAFAQRWPDRVAGLVYVDPVSLVTWANCSAPDRQRLAKGAELSKRGAWLARVGVVRFALAAATAGKARLTRSVARASAGQATPFLARLVGEIQKLPSEVLPAVRSHWSRPKSFEAMASHLAALPSCAEAAVALAIPPSIPFIVLSAADAKPEELAERDSWVRENAAGQHRIIERTGHWLHLDRPEAVVATVKELADFHLSAASKAR